MRETENVTRFLNVYVQHGLPDIRLGHPYRDISQCSEHALGPVAGQIKIIVDGDKLASVEIAEGKKND